ncbi:hypothetical protein AAG906_036424 [Vitis piasezkii]
MSNELASTLASIQEFMVGVNRRLDQIESSCQDPHPIGMVTNEIVPHASQTAQTFQPGASLGIPFHLADHYETIPPPNVTMPPPIVPTTDDTLLVEDGISVTSLPAKFRMPNIERYSGIGCPKIHLRLYNTVMRAHGIDDAQLVTLFPMSLSGTCQRWFASDVAHEFLTQFSFSSDIDVSRRELEATKQREKRTRKGKQEWSGFRDAGMVALEESSAEIFFQNKLGDAFAPKPSSGPHKSKECLPLILILRNRLKYALTYREVIVILMQRHVLVDGKVRTNKTYPFGFMDVVSIPKTNENFRLLYDTKANNTTKLDLESNKITDIIKFDVGNVVMVIGGRNRGRVGVIKNREKHKGSI